MKIHVFYISLVGVLLVIGSLMIINQNKNYRNLKEELSYKKITPNLGEFDECTYALKAHNPYKTGAYLIEVNSKKGYLFCK